ncbi:MAG: sulfite exporter TauE/SafE family protein [Deltaproteobacteria bacterium]|nr:sulfite exporter TauE/SafE family protein [Deltaproteobacteria bacterium]
MDVFLPIAGMSFNFIVIVGIGGLVGFLSGLFGVGGGFLLTPLMMMIGVPPSVAAASDSNQICAAATSGAFGHWRLGNVDMKMGLIILIGGIAGGTIGVQAVKYLRDIGNFDFVIRAVYVLMLGGVGGAMFIESLNALRKSKAEKIQEGEMKPTKISMLFSRLPLQMEFKRSGLKTSAIFPFTAGFIVGFLAALMGVGGGFIMVPTMIYIIGMPTICAIGTDLFQIVITTANVTFMQAITNHTVDLVLVVLLFSGSVIGAQFGVRASRFLRGEQIRILLSIIVLIVMVKMLFDLLVIPDNLIGLTKAAGGGH